MSKQQHIIIFACYAVAGLVAMFALPALIYGLSAFTAILFGAVIILAGGLVHEMSARRANETQAVRRLIVLRKAYNQNQEDLARNRDELRRVYEVLEQFKNRKPDARKSDDLDEVASEVKVLHGLVQQLYSSSSDTAPPPVATAEQLDEDPTGTSFKSLPAVGGRKVSDLDDELLMNIVRDALRQNRVDLYLQPIVSLPQRKRRFFESFIHLRSADGVVIAPHEYAAVAEKAGLTLAIDNMLLFRSVQLLQKARDHNFSTVFFCNIAPNTFGDRTFFRDFIEFLENNREMAPCVVFQLAQADLATHAEDAAEDLQRLVDIGFRLCMNEVHDFNFDPKGLSEIGFSFVKIAADRVLVPEAPYSADGFGAIKTAMDLAEVDLVVENIETEQALIELLDFNIDLGQGYLFGEPRISKDPAKKKQAPELRVV